MNKIEKIKYTVTWFDPEKMTTGRRDIYEMFPNGKVTYHGYNGAGNRKCIRKSENTIATGADFQRLCERLTDCIAHADRENLFTDDTAAELKIYHSFNRMEILPRGYGSEREDVETIVCQFLSDIAHVDEK